jgi:hypothetical protein
VEKQLLSNLVKKIVNFAAINMAAKFFQYNIDLNGIDKKLVIR